MWAECQYMVNPSLLDSQSPAMNDCGGGPRILSRGEEVKRAFRMRHRTHEAMQSASPCVIESGLYDIARAQFRIYRVTVLFYHEVCARGRCITEAWPR